VHDIWEDDKMVDLGTPRVKVIQHFLRHNAARVCAVGTVIITYPAQGKIAFAFFITIISCEQAMLVSKKMKFKYEIWL